MNGGRTHRFEKQDTQANKRTALLREEVEVPYQIVWVLKQYTVQSCHYPLNSSPPHLSLMRAALVLCLPYASGLRATPSMPTSVMAPASFLLRLAAPTLCAKAGATSAEAGGYRSREDLKAGIAKFYDESSGLWERVWGEHMHHGYYPKGKPTPGPRQAQEDMISEVLRWSGATDGDTPPGRVLDVGCGIGGSTRYMARTLGCAGNGISLSPKQIGRAQALSEAQGLGKKLSFEVGLAPPPPPP